MEPIPSCIICFDPIDLTEDGFTPCCIQPNHKACLKKWLAIKPNCPHCRNESYFIRNQNAEEWLTFKETTIMMVVAAAVGGSVFLVFELLSLISAESG